MVDNDCIISLKCNFCNSSNIKYGDALDIKGGRIHVCIECLDCYKVYYIKI